MESKDRDEFILAHRKRVGDTIRIIRESRGYSQEQLAQVMEVSRSTISKIENGKFNLSIDYLSKFSWFLEFEFKLSQNVIRKSVA